MENSIELLRTYRRRSITKRSGFKASGEKTGSECLINFSESFILEKNTAEIQIKLDQAHLIELFQKEISLIALGGYIKSSNTIELKLNIKYSLPDGTKISENCKKSVFEENNWNGFGMHITQAISTAESTLIKNLIATISISGKIGTTISLSSVDFNVIDYTDYLSEEFYKPFNQKTSMHIPHIYYLSTIKKFEDFNFNLNGLKTYSDIQDIIILKSCNRCTRYIPINIWKEQSTLGFSLHCKKKAPCSHKNFSQYRIDNLSKIPPTLIKELQSTSILANSHIHSYYGHQLECKACKKYYVNNALNHKREPHQFKEDSLRRRAIEVLVNNLLERKLVHHEYEHRTKRQFTEDIWKKFDCRCFKCSKKIKLQEMNLDHTMPLAYLYRLDESATCLCAEHNSQKSDSFPIDYYTLDELIRLSKITNLNMNILTSRSPNEEVVKLLLENIVWFFDDFLARDEYQKKRKGILTANKIVDSLHRVLYSKNINLIDVYENKTSKKPSTIQVK